MKKLFQEPAITIDEIEETIFTSVGVDWDSTNWGDDWDPWLN